MGDKFSLKNWLTFEEARDVVRDECLVSVVQYKRWWDRNRPVQIPKYPYNVWKTEWQGWNDFLGNDNVFDYGKRQWRPYLEAVDYVHKLKVPGQRAWFDYVRDEGIPEDIPAHPELVYTKTWISWNQWLGNKARARVEHQKAALADAGILYIIHIPGRPANIFRIGVTLGKTELGSYVKEKRASIIKLFKMEPGYDWAAGIAPWASPWWEGDQEYVVANVNEMIFELGSDLLFA